MKKKEIAFGLMVMLVLAFGCTAEKTVQEEVVVPEPQQEITGEPDGILDCPRGQVDDPYPGQCGGYIDTNEDDICDRSQ